ncbi:hypothetical protein QE152_g25195 [Popillia japonica]|uniref:Fibronectin type-III domain-containing protein n=1 Tax=Popillia japonica TaxID=7064 RepID=A0AAW1K0Z7_POPJA
MKNVYLLFVEVLVLLAVISVLRCKAEEEISCDNLQITVNIQETHIVATVYPLSCSVVYFVTHYVNCYPIATGFIPQPASSTNLNRHPNSRNRITIQLTATGDVVGSINFVDGTVDDTEVLHLQFNENNRSFQWFPPIIPEQCAETIQYYIEFENENTEESVIISDTSFQIPDHPCTTNVINVTTIIGFDNSRSDPISATALSPISREPPKHNLTLPGIDTATVYWEMKYEPNNLCQIKAIVFDVTDDTAVTLSFETEISVDTWWISYIFENLQPNTHYTYTTCYIMAPSDNRICSPEEINFTTLSVDCESNLRVDQTNDEFIVNWDRCSGNVRSYVLRIQPIEPVHFVPANCHFDLSSTEIILNGTDTTSYNFTGAEASFRYTIELLTHFKESTFTEEIYVISNERTPGDLVIRTSYQGEPSSPYDITLKASWNLPCNVNGRVQRFDYSLTGSLNSHSIVSCRDIALSSGSIDVVEGQVTFKAFIPDIIPSFNHTLRVTTVLARHEGSTMIDLGAPPPAYTSPNWQCTSWIY